MLQLTPAPAVGDGRLQGALGDGSWVTNPPPLQSFLFWLSVHFSAKSNPSAAYLQGSERELLLPVADLEKLQPTPDC